MEKKVPQKLFLGIFITLYLLVGLAFSSTLNADPLDKANASNKTLKALELAKSSIRNHDYTTAAKFATVAIADSPRYIPGYLFRAKIWISEGAYINAIKDYSSVIKIEPKKYPQYYRYRGDCFIELGQYALGIRDYTKSLEINPNLHKSLYYRARAYALAGQTASALRDIERGISLGTHHTDWFVKLRDAILTGEPIPYNKPVSN